MHKLPISVSALPIKVGSSWGHNVKISEIKCSNPAWHQIPLSEKKEKEYSVTCLAGFPPQL